MEELKIQVEELTKSLPRAEYVHWWKPRDDTPFSLRHKKEFLERLMKKIEEMSRNGPCVSMLCFEYSLEVVRDLDPMWIHRVLTEAGYEWRLDPSVHGNDFARISVIVPEKYFQARWGVMLVS